MIGAIAAILLGCASIVILARTQNVRSKSLTSKVEKKLLKKWLSACCIGFFFSLTVPGLLELTGVIPVGSVGCAGAILCFIFVSQSSRWYRKRLVQASRTKPEISRCQYLRPARVGHVPWRLQAMAKGDRHQMQGWH
jgi:hypothetical protein